MKKNVIVTDTLLAANVQKRRRIINYYIGIDVSKNKLDYAVFRKENFLFHCERQNSSTEILGFVQDLKEYPQFKISKAIFCFEQTGLYGNHLLATLSKLKANIVVEHPVTIKNSSGLLRGKDDKVDAIRIAKYAYNFEHKLKFWLPKRPVVLQLMNFVTLRNRLLGMSTALKAPLIESMQFNSIKRNLADSAGCQKTISAISEDLLSVNEKIQLIIASDETLKRLVKVITSVPSIGLQTAVYIIICTNEFKDITDPKKFAAYAGIAPFKKESGAQKSKARVSHIANKKMKSLMHICAIVSVRCNPEIKAYYLRKTTIEGKHAMSVINAIRYKLILRIFSCLKSDRCYTADYQHPPIYQQANQKLTEDNRLK